MLAIYTGKIVTPMVNLREHRSISHMPLSKCIWLHRGDNTRSPKQRYQLPHKWTCVQQFYKKAYTVKLTPATNIYYLPLCNYYSTLYFYHILKSCLMQIKNVYNSMYPRFLMCLLFRSFLLNKIFNLITLIIEILIQAI